MGDWCILRCANAATIPLLRSLTRAGIEAWTPVEQVTRRVPRANVKRTVDHAMLPSYVFARFAHLPELIAICESPKSEHRQFRVFHMHGKMPLVSDETLSPLRLLERKGKAKALAATISPGDPVKMEDGGFAGMRGVVEAVKGGFATVRIDGFNLPLKVATFYLLQSKEKCEIQSAA